MTPPLDNSLQATIRRATLNARAIGITWVGLRAVIIKCADEAGQHHLGKRARMAILRALREVEDGDPDATPSD